MEKNFKLRKLLSLVLVLAALGSCFAVFASAAGNEAQDFIDAVAALDAVSIANLEEKQTKLEVAEAALRAYLAIDGNNIGDAAISAANSTLVDNRTDMFCEYVTKADTAWDRLNYVETRANLDLAAPIVNGINQSDNNASNLKNIYTAIVEELAEPEDLSKSYVDRAKAAAEATTFEVANRNYESAMLLEDKLTLAGYPGIEEAAESLRETKKYIARCIVAATPFLTAVDNIYDAESIRIGIENANAKLVGIDVTTKGVPEAKAKLDELIFEYNKDAKAANKAAGFANNTVFSLFLNGR